MIHSFILAMAVVWGFMGALFLALWLSYLICPERKENDSEDIQGNQGAVQ